VDVEILADVVGVAGFDDIPHDISFGNCGRHTAAGIWGLCAHKFDLNQIYNLKANLVVIECR
jgi:hypothetical protein